MATTNTRFIVRNGLDNNLQTIVNVATPSGNNDAANKKYVDDNAGGSPSAAVVSIADVGNYYTGANVEAALQEAGPMVLNGVYTSDPVLGDPVSIDADTLEGYNAACFAQLTGATFSGVITSTKADGNAPFVVTSTTKVTNLNTDRLDDLHAGNTTGLIPISNGIVNTNLNADMVDGIHLLGSGAILDNGANYIKYWDGTMIEWLSTTVTDQAINTAYGSLYRGIRTWTFPVAFNAVPTVSCSLFKWGTGGSWGSLNGLPNTTAVELTGTDVNTRATGTNCYISAVAIGRWK